MRSDHDGEIYKTTDGMTDHERVKLHIQTIRKAMASQIARRTGMTAKRTS